MSQITTVKKQLFSLASKERAKASAWFFKTGSGQYGYGDVFIGVKVPDMRKVAHRHLELSLSEVQKLLSSKIHEHRFVALEILVAQYEKGGEDIKKKIFNFYLRNTSRINNWDLVDTSAPYIVGRYLVGKSREVLYRLAKSKNIWERRIAIVSTSAFIALNDFVETLAIAEILLSDKHDLIHKAVGWMLREVGKKSETTLKTFLNRHLAYIPRTTLRYAIERLPEAERKKYLLKKK